MTDQERSTAHHEAGHATAARVQGLDVRSVSRVSSDPTSYLGYTLIPLSDLTEDMDPRRARKAAIMFLCGPLMSDQGAPDWPLSTQRTNDERLVKAYVQYLKLDEAGYNALVDEAIDLTVTPKFSRLFLALTTWLENQPRMDTIALAEAQTMAWM